MDVQFQLPWVLEEPCLLEHLPNMDRGGIFRSVKLQETGKWRDSCVDVLFTSQRHC